MENRKVYADNAATTKMAPEVIRAMTECMERVYENPSSLHTGGQRAKEVLEAAREEIAAAIGATAREITFTSGGTESDNQAILTALAIGKKKNKHHIVTTAFEHHAILHTLKRLEAEGKAEVTYLDVGSIGNITPEQVKEAIREDTCLVTVMYANNEIGSVLPIREIGEICRAAGVLFHTDAVQAVGHLPVNVQKDNIDMLSFSAHKFRGPKGFGVLYARRGVVLSNLMEGGAQERGKRPGTENIAAAVGTAKALTLAVSHLPEESARLTALRDKLIAGLTGISHSALNGDPVHRLPGNVNFCFEGIEGEGMLLLLDAFGIEASSGSACTSGSLDPSHVLLAIGRPHEIAHGSLRLTLGADNTEEDVDYMLEKIPGVVERLRNMSPLWHDKVEGKKPFVL